MICKCNEWKPNMEIINLMGVIAINQGFKEIPKEFKNCPYCGKKLVKR
jgi:hypothetical protein